MTLSVWFVINMKESYLAHDDFRYLLNHDCSARVLVVMAVAAI